MTRYIFCVIAVLVQPLFVWYVYHKQDKREAALKIPMIGCSVLYLVVQIYAFFKLCIKIPGKYVSEFPVLRSLRLTTHPFSHQEAVL